MRKETKKEMLYHTDRRIALANHKAALAAVRVAEGGNDLASWEAAQAKYEETLKALVKAEMEHPTYEELKKEANDRRLRNRGLDF